MVALTYRSGAAEPQSGLASASEISHDYGNLESSTISTPACS